VLEDEDRDPEYAQIIEGDSKDRQGEYNDEKEDFMNQ
jgi:hypothetical protein